MFTDFCLFTSISIWTYLIFFHGRRVLSFDHFFWSNKIIFENIFGFNRKSNSIYNNSRHETSVVIPARNEENTISLCIESLINQRDVNLNIIIINDQSTDKTVKVSQNIFSKFNFKKYKILDSKLKKGWSGKTWALNQGLNEAIKNKNNKFILFLDADITIEKNLIKNLIHVIKKDNLNMISLMAKLNCISIWEKVLIPSFIFFFQKLYPFNLVNLKEKSCAAAAGGCVFGKINTFSESNVFNLIKNKIIDDCNLAKILKQKGNIWLGLSEKIISTRKYNSLNSIWIMVSRCAYEQLKNSPIILFFSIIFMILMYLMWPINLITSIFISKDLIYLETLIIFSLSSICYFPTIKFYKLNFLYCLTLPIAASLYMLMTLSSAFNYHFKKGNEWKGRRY